LKREIDVTRTIRAWTMRCLIVLSVSAGLGVTLRPEGIEPASGAPAAASGPVWPAPPARPSIRFSETVLSREHPAERRGSLLRRLGRVLFTKTPDAVVRPIGVVAKNGILYVTDPGSHALVVSDLAQGSVQQITRAGGDSLVSPVGVAVGADRVFVSDSSRQRIYTYDRKGRFLRTFAASGLVRPTGLAVEEATGRLYVADTGAHQVRIYRPDGELERTLGRRGTAEGEFNFPTYLSLDAGGRLSVVDSLNYRIQTFGADGSLVATFGRHGDGSGDFSSPKGIASDSRGHLYVVDALFDAVQIFDRQGRLLLAFGARGVGPGQFWLPSGIFIDERDRIYVADSYNRRIEIFEFVGAPDAER
jgi:DNA-binding beta-propeller fold protein YncE